MSFRLLATATALQILMRTSRLLIDVVLATRSLSGASLDTLAFAVFHTDIVFFLKQMLQATELLSPEHQVVSFNGHVLQNDFTLFQCNVQWGDFLQMHFMAACSLTGLTTWS